MIRLHTVVNFISESLGRLKFGSDMAKLPPFIVPVKQMLRQVAVADQGLDRSVYLGLPRSSAMNCVVSEGQEHVPNR